MSNANFESDPSTVLEYKLMDLEAIADLMINVQTDHMVGEDVEKFGGVIWRLHGELQKAFYGMGKEKTDEVVKLQGDAS